MLKPLLALSLCLTLPFASAGQTMLFVADDLSGLPTTLEMAVTAAMAADDSPVVLIIKDTQVALAMRGSTLERDMREGLSNKVRIFVCEADIKLYGLEKNKVLQGITVVPAALPKSESSVQPAAEARPLERFRKQAEKVCEQ